AQKSRRGSSVGVRRCFMKIRRRQALPCRASSSGYIAPTYLRPQGTKGGSEAFLSAGQVLYKAGRRRLPCAWRAPSCQVPGPTDREGQAGDGLHQRRGGGGPPHQGRTVPRGG